MSLDMEDTFQGKAFKVNNPNAPEAVRQMSASDLKKHMDAGDEVHLIDVRPSDELQQACINGAIALEDGGAAQLEALSKEAMLVFYCHSGQRSQAAAEHFRIQGFNNVRNLEGGIDAWSRDVDASVPRY